MDESIVSTQTDVKGGAPQRASDIPPFGGHSKFEVCTTPNRVLLKRKRERLDGLTERLAVVRPKVDARTPQPRPPRGGPNTVSLAPAAHGRQRLYTWKELKDLPPPEWLIDGILPKGGFAVLFGPPGVGKTFLALDWALTRALAGDLTVYIAGEGKPGLPKRVQAWLTKQGQPDNPLDSFLVHDGSVDMLADKEVKSFIESLKGRAPRLIVLDTLARCFGGKDENSAQDMGRFIHNCDRLREVWPDCTVLVLHHTGKDPTRGARGSSALNGAVDCAMELSEGGDALFLGCDKMKDAEPFKTKTLRLEPKDTSCIIAWGQDAPEVASKLTKGAAKALDLLKKLIGEKGAARVPLAKWRRRCDRGGVSNSPKPDARRKAFDRAVKQLEGRGKIQVVGDDVLLDSGTGQDNP